MKRKSVVKFWERFNRFLQTADAEIIENDDKSLPDIVKVEIPMSPDYNAVEGVAGYCNYDKAKESWEFTVKDEEGENVKLIYYDFEKDDKAKKRWLYFEIGEFTEDELKALDGTESNDEKKEPETEEVST